ncbi:PEGA domain-containing protein [Candidatus Saccharibacteria bacterium]|nr:PEGA domain-containing protein [Candidatus Saccharibacteria bacterium]
MSPQQKKQKTRRLFLGYGLLSVLVVLASYILISTALGYELFSSNGQVVQNGLLFVNSRPNGADIYVNGSKEASGTNAKLALPEGVYEISLRKDGYKEWRSSVDLMGGTVEFLSFPRLLPSDPKQLADIPYQNGTVTALQSRDKRWLALSLLDGSNNIDLYDLDNPNTPAIKFSLPVSLTGDKTYRLSKYLEWAGDNKHFLARFESDGSPLIVLFNREDPVDLDNLTSTLGLQPTDEIGFWDAKWDQIYIHHQAGIVQLANAKDHSLEAAPITSDSVLEFLPIGGKRAVYSVAGPSDKEVNLKILAEEKSYIFMTIDKSDKPLIMHAAGFNRNDYIALGGGSLEKTMLFKNLRVQVKTAENNHVAPYVLLPIQASDLDFSRTNRFIFATDGLQNSVYDIEQKEYFKYDVPAKNPALSGWFDDARLYSVGFDKTLSIYDFNGDNVYKISESVNGVPYVNGGVTHATFDFQSTSSQSLRTIDIETATN